MIAKVERMSDSPDNRPDLRISDIDRDRAAEVLREAHAQGRITVDELDERLTSVYNAKTFAEAVTTIKAVAVMGGMEITVPEDAEVEVGAFGVMGGVDHGGEGPGAPEAPRIRITGVAVMGGIEVKRAPARRSSQGELPSPG